LLALALQADEDFGDIAWISWQLQTGQYTGIKSETEAAAMREAAGELVDLMKGASRCPGRLKK
jgi:hypothetical protein